MIRQKLQTLAGLNRDLHRGAGGPILTVRKITVTEAPRDLMFDADTRKAEFAKLHKMGVKGVKVDFFQSDKQHIIQQYIGILKDAADNQVMVNFHGCTLPRGWQRTWPNLVGMEAIVGEECYMSSETYPKTAVWHNTIQPFTRNAVGSAKLKIKDFQVLVFFALCIPPQPFIGG